MICTAKSTWGKEIEIPPRTDFEDLEIWHIKANVCQCAFSILYLEQNFESPQTLAHDSPFKIREEGEKVTEY